MAAHSHLCLLIALCALGTLTNGKMMEFFMEFLLPRVAGKLASCNEGRPRDGLWGNNGHIHMRNPDAARANDSLVLFHFVSRYLCSSKIMFLWKLHENGSVSL